MRIESFEPWHCEGATAHPFQAHYQYMLDDPASYEDQWPETCSAIDGDELIAIGGAVPVGDATGGWLLFTDKITPARFLAIHRAVVRRMERIHGPIIVHIDPDGPQATRWATMLGMNGRQLETMPDGREMARMTTHA